MEKIFDFYKGSSEYITIEEALQNLYGEYELKRRGYERGTGNYAYCTDMMSEIASLAKRYEMDTEYMDEE